MKKNERATTAGGGARQALLLLRVAETPLDAADEERLFDEGEEGLPLPPLPDIAPLTQQESSAVLPLTPLPDQVAFFNSDGAAVVQRLGLSLLVTLATAKAAPAAAAGALTLPLWYPLAAAAVRNGKLRGVNSFSAALGGRRGRKKRSNASTAATTAVGIWRARVLDARVGNGRRGGNRSSPPSASPLGLGPPTLTLTLGDDSGATTKLVVPYERVHDAIEVGEAAELLVVASGKQQRHRKRRTRFDDDDDDIASAFGGFRAVREAYLPGAGLWVSGDEYPSLDRRAFVRVSLSIEEERRAEEEAAAEEAEFAAAANAAAAAEEGPSPYAGGGSEEEGGGGFVL